MGGRVLHWDYFDPAVSASGRDPFAVDGPYFYRSALLDVIRRVLYHNPVTLELLASATCGRSGCSAGYGPLHASMAAVSLNKVSYIVPHNRRGNVSVEC